MCEAGVNIKAMHDILGYADADLRRSDQGFEEV
ncbi:hypothetical protein [uncultured Clostridium sp.]